MKELTKEVADNLLKYDPNTGVFTWRLKRTGSKIGTVAGILRERTGYRYLTLYGTAYAAHRVAWLMMTGAAPKHQIDHINKDQGDNRWANLREATATQNTRNTRSHKGSSSIFKGVSLLGYRAASAIGNSGKVKVFGQFAFETDAAICYNYNVAYCDAFSHINLIPAESYMHD